MNPFFGINFATGEVDPDRALAAFARDLNRAGRLARDAGLKLGYHNHNWEFVRLDDGSRDRAYDVLTDHRPGPGAPGARPVLGLAGGRDPVDLFRQNGAGPAVPRQGHEPGRQFR